MPTGRCTNAMLPPLSAVIGFMKKIQYSFDLMHKLRFHHTLTDDTCFALKKRIFINYNGDIFGCGWINNNSPILCNLHDTNFFDVLNKMEQASYHSCALRHPNNFTQL
jgi:hypothetical protein